MTYAFDPEVAAVIPMLPPTNITDLAVAREQIVAMTAEQIAGADSTGVTVREELVPGPEGAPDVRVRIYTVT